MRRQIAALLVLTLLLPVSASADAQENQQIIYTYLTETMGLTRAAACGVLSNIKSESNFRPEAVGDNGNAYGICQWNSRRQSLINFCENNGYGDWTNLEGQLGYLAYELESSKKSVGNYLKSIPDTAQGAYDAAWYFCVYFEIPADRYNKAVKRGSTAVNTFWKSYGGTTETYTVRYDANGGKNAPASGTKTEGVPYTVTSSEPVRTGYTVAGWSEDPKATVPSYVAGDLFSENRNATLYAVWERSMEAETQPDATITLNGHTYEYYAGSHTYARAQSFAAVKGGYLASVRTAEEAKAVVSLIDKGGVSWLGGIYRNGNWGWSSGESFSDAFAEAYWAEGEPAAIWGPSARGYLAMTGDGKWIDLTHTDSADGLVIEYGEPENETFPMYLLTVSTSLRLREGPGTSYSTLSYLYSGDRICMAEACPENGWGFCFTDDGRSGWCSMKVPDYMVPVSVMDEETGLLMRFDEDHYAILRYSGAASDWEIPPLFGQIPISAIESGAFADGVPSRLTVPDSVTQIASGAFSASMTVAGSAGSAAHFAAVADGCAFEILYPENAVILTEAVEEIESEAFYGADAVELFDFSHTGLISVGPRAFASCARLQAVLLPESVSFIADDAFPDRTVLVTVPGSYAEAWAQSRRHPCVAYSGR